MAGRIEWSLCNKYFTCRASFFLHWFWFLVWNIITRKIHKMCRNHSLVLQFYHMYSHHKCFWALYTWNHNVCIFWWITLFHSTLWLLKIYQFVYHSLLLQIVVWFLRYVVSWYIIWFFILLANIIWIVFRF